MTDTHVFHLPQESDTIRLGAFLARMAQKGDVFALYGTLGMGKSVLARAFVQELLGKTEVPSPTFTLVQSYEAPAFEIYHFDLYRLKNPDEIFEIGVEDALYGGVSLIEWPDRMRPYLPRDVFKINIEAEGEGRRLGISVDSPSKNQRLISLYSSWNKENGF